MTLQLIKNILSFILAVVIEKQKNCAMSYKASKV